MKPFPVASILVIENDEIEARGVKSSLISRGCKDVYYCLTEVDARILVAERTFELILLKGRVDGHEGISLTKEILLINPETMIVMRSPETPWSLAQDVERAGGRALVSTSIALPALIDVLEDLVRHRERFIFIGDRVSSELINTLTLSEREVLRQLSSGLTTREIAQQRHNSEATIKSHLTSIYRKLGVRNRVEAIAHLPR